MNQSIIRPFICYTALLLLAISCRVSKPYERPPLDVPTAFRGVSYADTSSIADISWQELFTDTILRRLILQGLQQNPDRLMAVKRMEIAGKRVRQSKLLNLPDLNLQITATSNRPSENSLNGISANSFLGKSHVENYLASATVSWEADIWGKIRGQKELVVAQYLQSYEGMKAVETELVANIAQGYYNLLLLDKQLEIARRNLVLNDSFLVATRLLKDAGLSNLLAVQQAEVRKQSTALLIPQLEEAIAVQENALQVVTGEFPSGITRNQQLENYEVPDRQVAGLPIALISRRPDVRAAEMELMAAHAEMGIAKANMYPALNFTLGGGLESFKASNWFNIPGSLFGLAAGTIAQPIFQRGRLKMESQIAQLRREESVIRFRQSLLRATGEVADALVRIEKLKEQESIVSAQTDTLQKAIGNARSLFRSDMATYLEVIAVQGNALDAELYQATVRRDRLNAYVDLYRSLGGGAK